jgi:possible endodeoxyribonuclease
MQILNNVFNERTINIMMDIETTGVRPGCRVLSIGLAVFYVVNGECTIGNTTTIYPDLTEQVGIDDPSTLQWWSTQSPEARNVFADNHINGVSVGKAFELFKEFIQNAVDWHKSLNDGAEKVNVCIWGNGATFDNSIVQHMFEAKGYPVPWNTFGDRCYRTAFNMLGRPSFTRDGTHHNALDDAIYQARCLTSALLNASK